MTLAGSLSLLGYLTYNRLSYLSKASEYQKLMSGKKITSVSANTPTKSLKDGQLVLLSDYITTPQTLKMDLKDSYGRKYDKIQYRALLMYMLMEEKTSGRHSHWEDDLEKTIYATNVKIGSLPVDTNIILNGLKERMEIYSQEYNKHFRAKVEVIPCFEISCIAMWKDGRLQKTSEEFPFAYIPQRGVSKNDVLAYTTYKAEEDVKAIMPYTIGNIILLIICAIFYRIEREKGQDTEYSKGLTFMEDWIKKINKIRALVLTAMIVISIVTTVLVAVFVFDQIFKDEFRLIILFLIVLSGFIGSMAGGLVGEFLEQKIIVKYKRKVWDDITSRYDGYLVPEAFDVKLTSEAFNQFGLVEEQYEDEKGGFFKKSIKYEFAFEDLFRTKSDKNGCGFYEVVINKTTGSGKNANTSSVFRSFNIEIPMENAGDLFMVALSAGQYCYNDELKCFSPAGEEWKTIKPRLNFFAKDERKLNDFIASSNIVEMMKNISATLSTEMNEQCLAFVIYNKVLYVFAITERDRFEVCLFRHLTSDTVEDDYRTIDVMSRIGRELS